MRRQRPSLDFQDLKTLKADLKAQQVLTKQAQLETQQLAQELQREANLFHDIMKEVTPLHPPNHVQPARPQTQLIPPKKLTDEETVLTESLSDDYGAEWLIQTDENASFRRQHIGIDVVHKLKQGKWTVQAQLDLHGYRVDGARQVLNAFLNECLKQEIRCVRIIHGKGLGSFNRIPILKEKVKRWLIQKNEVIAFVESPENDGGAGALRVLLKHMRPTID